MAFFSWRIKRFPRIIVAVPVGRNSLPKDPAILLQMIVDLTTQLDKTQRLLRQLLEAKHSTKSEQLSPDQLEIFLAELNRSKAASKDHDQLPRPEAGMIGLNAPFGGLAASVEPRVLSVSRRP